jgi:hypothetical protein
MAKAMSAQLQSANENSGLDDEATTHSSKRHKVIDMA